MSTSQLNHYVVTFRFQKSGLTSLLELSSAMTAAGFSTTHNDKQGHHSELGTNNFGIITALEIDDIRQQAQSIGEIILDETPDVDVQTYEQFSAQEKN